MSIIEQVQQHAIECLKALYQGDFTEKDFQVNQTKPEFRGDYTVVLFSLVKSLKLSPDEIGQKLGAEMARRHPDTYLGFNIIKGFLNLEISDAYWLQVLEKNFDDVCFGKHPMNGKKVMVEYS
ncbi:MAG TPA: arginine--tRNA ligase, partial [Ferruginibacter sp.]|nr:arginine--tRNA ligase [Ferruginibacter sp.]